VKIDLHVERLILDGLPVDATQALQVQKAVQGELTSLLTSGGLHHALQAGENWQRVQPAGILITSGASPTHLGEQIAGAVYGGVGRK
jgi:hypothetical protein